MQIIEFASTSFAFGGAGRHYGTLCFAGMVLSLTYVRGSLRQRQSGCHMGSAATSAAPGRASGAGCQSAASTPTNPRRASATAPGGGAARPGGSLSNADANVAMRSCKRVCQISGASSACRPSTPPPVPMGRQSAVAASHRRQPSAHMSTAQRAPKIADMKRGKKRVTE